MRFLYRYQDHDGRLSEGSVSASSESDAYSLLRKSGVRPMKVWSAPGLANRLAALGRRGWSIIALSLLCLALAVAAFFPRAHFAEMRNPEAKPSAIDSFLTDATRHQVIGDAAVIEKGIRTGWADVFAREGDRFLASYAIPGTKPAVPAIAIPALEEVLSSPPTLSSSLEARQIVAMVSGMKAEARAYLAAGGSLEEYVKRLAERQREEIEVYGRVKSEVENARKNLSGPDLIAFWENCNDKLRNLGLRLISLED